MKKNKVLMILISGIFFIGLSFAQVSLIPIYSAERFKPSDKFHAGCENEIDVEFKLDNLDIAGVSAILNYNPEDIEILRVLAEEESKNKLSYVVESDKIILNKLKSDGVGSQSVKFSIFFKSLDDIDSSVFSFDDGSYVLDSKGNMVSISGEYLFQFSKVPECNPDIVAPSVQLLFPSDDTDKYVALDSYFQFKIIDQGKGVNTDSVNISINGIKYNLSNIENEWSGDILTIYPDMWMPFNTGFEVKINVDDKQVYGKANSTHERYEFKTSNEMNLLNDIEPIEFRKLVNMKKYYQGSDDECALIMDYFSKSSVEDELLLNSINKRLNCPDISNIDKIMVEGDPCDVETSVKYSVFAMTGWILFLSLGIFSIFLRFGIGKDNLKK